MKITELTGVKVNANVPDIAPGDTGKIGAVSKIKEGDKERVQPFQGVIIRIRKGDAGGSFYSKDGFAYGIGMQSELFNSFSRCWTKS